MRPVTLPFFICILLLPALVRAQPALSDFAYGMPLALNENGAVYLVSLPLELYQTVSRDDLDDIRIFNSAGTPVPHVLRRPVKKNEVVESFEQLPFFPLYQDKTGKEEAGVSVRIEKGKDGAIINVDSGGSTPGAERSVSGYIIDAGGQEEQIEELVVNWQGDRENFVTTVALEYSNDLTHWSSLVTRATLARMFFSGHEINKNRIQLPSRDAGYFRISWPAGQDGVAVAGISAIRRSGKSENKEIWTEVSGEAAAGEEGKGVAAFEYDSSSRLPVDRVRLRFSDKNTLVRATFFSRSDPDEKWRFRKSGVFYDLHFDQARLTQDSAEVGLVSDSYWRVETDEGVLGDSGVIPKLELGWQPHELLFVAQGEGPFTLAYGSARLDKESSRKNTAGLLAQVIGKEEDALLKKAELLPKTVLGGPEMLVPAPPPLPWRKWLLWGVLAAGVGIIARMALSLIRGMNG